MWGCRMLKQMAAQEIGYDLSARVAMEPAPMYCILFYFIPFYSIYLTTRWGHMVAQLVEALCYKPEGREFDS